MKNISLVIIGILLVFNTGISLKNSQRITSLEQKTTTSTMTSGQTISSIPQEVQELRKKSEKILVDEKIAMPYRFLSSKELVHYDCNTLTDTEKKQDCTNIVEGVKVSNLFQDLKPEQLSSFDCTTIQDKTLINKCIEYKKMTEEMFTRMPGTK